ncbi:MAG TPA: DUF2087 domain-containing protein [Jatrophihabitans sp.]|jgi:hypothetical protein|nr:DUF2087 domain-containing protein [Jatrophihabitans sp.]
MGERRSESADERAAEPIEAAGAVPASVERARELAEPAAFDEIADPALRRVLRAYLVRGRLPVLPRGGSKRTMLLEYLATAFEPGVRYREAEVNQTVAVWNPDVAALRRYLVDAGLLARENGLYWRCGGWV